MNSDFEHYFQLLDIRPEAPSVAALTQIVRKQMMRVPFENISKLYRMKTMALREIPGFAQHLEGIEKFHFGGTCYTNNYYLNRLLRFLGYEAALCGADMTKPDVHIVSLVRVEGREFIVDVGYGAPFLEPLARDLPVDFHIEDGADRYILKPRNGQGQSLLEHHRDGAVTHGYRLNPRPRTIDEFEGVIEDSFAPDATFMNAILLVRFTPDGTHRIRNMMYSDSRAKISRRLESRAELVQTIHDVFEMPADMVTLALDGISLKDEMWS